MLGGARLRHDGAGGRFGPGPLEDLAPVVAGQIVGIGQPHINRRDPARHEVVGERLDGGLLRGSRSQCHQRVQREKPEIERRAVREREPDEVRFDQLEGAAAPRDLGGSPSPGAIEHVAVVVDACHAVAGCRKRNGDAAGPDGQLQDAARRPRSASAR